MKPTPIGKGFGGVQIDLPRPRPLPVVVLQVSGEGLLPAQCDQIGTGQLVQGAAGDPRRVRRGPQIDVARAGLQPLHLGGGVHGGSGDRQRQSPPGTVDDIAAGDPGARAGAPQICPPVAVVGDVLPGIPRFGGTAEPDHFGAVGERGPAQRHRRGQRRQEVAEHPGPDQPELTVDRGAVPGGDTRETGFRRVGVQAGQPILLSCAHRPAPAGAAVIELPGQRLPAQVRAHHQQGGGVQAGLRGPGRLGCGHRCGTR